MRVIVTLCLVAMMSACGSTMPQDSSNGHSKPPDGALPPTQTGELATSVPRLESCDFQAIQVEIDPPTVAHPLPLVLIIPEYPERAWNERKEGWAHLRFDIATDGVVSNISIVDAQPYHAFGELAAQMLAKWRFLSWRIGRQAYPQPDSEIVIEFRLCPAKSQ